MTQQHIAPVRERFPAAGRRYDLFYRNPTNYHQQLLRLGEVNVSFDVGILIRRSINPVRFGDIAFGRTWPWRIYAIGDYFTQEYDRTSEPDRPKAVYPSWSYKEGFETLLEHINTPWGATMEYCMNPQIPLAQRPVFGQPHRIVINEMPDTGSIEGQMVWSRLSDIQQDHPHVEFHIHRSYSYYNLFGLAFTSGSVNPRDSAGNGKITLPNGSAITADRFMEFKKDIEAIGYDVRSLSDPKVRCEFNITSARVAAHNFPTYRRPARKTSKDFFPDIYSPTMTARVPRINETRWAKSEVGDRDQYICNSCDLWRKCSNYKEGSVCTLTNTPGKRLADLFKTTDPTKIVEGLRSIVEHQADRVERHIDNEDPYEPNKDIDKQLNSVFRNATTLAKMLDPSLRGGMQVNVVNGQVGVASSSRVASIIANEDSPKAIAGSVMEEIEQRTGLPREQITDEVVEKYIRENMPQDAEIVDGGQ